ncbi:HD domain-containing protein [Tenacibaculum xiamenense]|uniref:HD domain-containing protein n=1 Tax=Tenacibaculum xiamenense TaxID=1261553 RepID=UPI0038B5D08C
MNLQERFQSLMTSYETSEDIIEDLWSKIHQFYSKKERAYHNLNHLQELFKYHDLYKEQLSSPDIVSFSIFYHDIIYDIWKKDNEEKSAEVALIELQKIDLPYLFYKEIENQILATKTHQAASLDGKFMVDFDLSILGQSNKIYTDYTQKIRKEYRLIPSILYKKGRKKVLEHFLAKENIYSTVPFKNLYEKQARENLANELKTL